MKKGKIKDMRKLLAGVDECTLLGRDTVMFALNRSKTVLYCGQSDFIACVRQQVPEVRYMYGDSKRAVMVSTVAEFSSAVARAAESGVRTVCVDDELFADLYRGYSRRVS